MICTALNHLVIAKANTTRGIVALLLPPSAETSKDEAVRQLAGCNFEYLP
jgi:hypothetical protein